MQKNLLDKSRYTPYNVVDHDPYRIRLTLSNRSLEGRDLDKPELYFQNRKIALVQMMHESVSGGRETDMTFTWRLIVRYDGQSSIERRM